MEVREVFSGLLGVLSTIVAVSFVPSYEVTGGRAGIPDVVALGLLGSLGLGVAVGFITDYLWRKITE